MSTATSGSNANNELQIYTTLLAEGLNTAAACGVLANLQAESGFNPKNLQNSYEGSLGYNDESYTAAVDNGSYRNFSKDSAGYGIAQWTYSSRKKALYNYAKKTKNTSIGDLSMQIGFLISELKGKSGYSDYKSVWPMLLDIEDTDEGARKAGEKFCELFEKPKNPNAPTTRGNTAKYTFWEIYSNAKDIPKAVPNVGQQIVQIARSLLDLEYIWGGDLYKNNKQGTDCSGLVHYCYNEAGVSIPDNTADGYYNTYKKSAKIISEDEVAAADLLFYKSSKDNKVTHIAIANGSGGRIHAKDENSGIVEEQSLGNPTYILRVLSDAQTSQGEVPLVEEDEFESLDALEYTALTAYDPYISTMQKYLSRVEDAGYDYGYLIDLDHGEEFKFYIPEFTERAGALWGTVDIRGRSVAVRTYESTASRTVSISLDLYAGAGLYEPRSGESGEDTVGRMHKDAYFLKSLEYPDYTEAIIKPPPTVHLILGSAINFVGVVSEVSVEHLKPVDSYNRSMYLKVSFTVTQVAVNPIDYKDVRNSQYTIKSTEDIGSLLVGDIQGAITQTLTTNAPKAISSSPRVIVESLGNTYEPLISKLVRSMDDE